MRFLTNPSTDPWFNMSFDEYCLEQYASDDNFFYLWRNRPSVIIGLNQNAYSEVNLGYLNAQLGKAVSRLFPALFKAFYLCEAIFYFSLRALD